MDGIDDVSVVQTVQFVEQFVDRVHERGEQMQNIDTGRVEHLGHGGRRVVGERREAEITKDLVDRAGGAYQRHPGPGDDDASSQYVLMLLRAPRAAENTLG